MFESTFFYKLQKTDAQIPMAITATPTKGGLPMLRLITLTRPRVLPVNTVKLCYFFGKSGRGLI